MEAQFFGLSHRSNGRISDIFDDFLDVFELGSRISLSDEESSRGKDILFDILVSNEGINEIINSALEFFSSAFKINLLEGQDELQLGCFGESAVMEVAIGENSMKTIAITVARLVEDVDGLEDTVFVSKFSLEDVRDFGLRLGSEAHSGSAVLLGCWPIDEVSVGELSLEWGVGQDVARRCLAYFREAEDGNGLIKEGEE